MLQMPQKRVGRGQFVKIMAADVALVVKFVKGEERAPRTKPGLGAPVHALQALHQKLDVADPATINFYVDGFMTFRSDLAAALFVDLFTCNQRGLDGSEVDLLAVHLRLHATDKL